MIQIAAPHGTVLWPRADVAPACHQRDLEHGFLPPGSSSHTFRWSPHGHPPPCPRLRSQAAARPLCKALLYDLDSGTGADGTNLRFRQVPTERLPWTHLPPPPYAAPAVAPPDAFVFLGEGEGEEATAYWAIDGGEGEDTYVRTLGNPFSFAI